MKFPPMHTWPDWVCILLFISAGAACGLAAAGLLWLAWPDAPAFVSAAAAGTGMPLAFAIYYCTDEIAVWFAENVWGRIR